MAVFSIKVTKLVQAVIIMVIIYGVEGTIVSEEQARQLLSEHNRYRAGERSSNMRMLTWDSSLAQQADRWIRKCDFSHGYPEVHGLQYPRNGQNLWASGGELDLDTAMRKWFEEKEDYDYRTKTCRRGKVCGHYTQMVWAESHLMGCAYKRCSSARNVNWRNVMMLACNYGPAGNWGVFASSEAPYKRGRPCSSCTTWNGECSDSLCFDCSNHGGNCTCSLACQNCGTPANGTCQCNCPTGYGGQHCNELCRDYNNDCGRRYKQSMCDDPEKFYVPYECPAMCGRCESEQREAQRCTVNTATYEVSVPIKDGALRVGTSALTLSVAAVVFLYKQ